MAPRFTPIIFAACLVMGVVSTASAQERDDQIREQLLEHLRQAAVDVDFTSRYMIRRTPAEVDGEKPEGLIHTVVERDVRVQYIGHRMASAMLEQTRAENHDYQRTVSRRFVIDDHVSYTVMDDGVNIGSGGLIVHQHRPIFDATFDRGTRPSLAIAAQRGIDFRVDRFGENSLRYIFHHGPDHPNIIYQFIFDVDPVVRLRVYERLARSGDDNGWTGMSVEEFRVFDWLEVDGKHLPRRAVHVARSFNRGDFEGKWLVQHTHFERTAFEVLDNPAAHVHRFEISYEPGMLIQDERYGLLFEIGSKRIRVDEISYELAEPLMQPPGARLEELLKTARRLTPE